MVSIMPGMENTEPERTDTKQRPVRIAETLAGGSLERLQVVLDLLARAPPGSRPSRE